MSHTTPADDRLHQCVRAHADRAAAVYRDVVRALEQAFVPVVSPTNTRGSFGSVQDLTNQQSKWELVLVDDRPRCAADNSALMGLLTLLWQGQ